jgi:hypothetical protein
MALARNKSFIGIAKETTHAAGALPTAVTPTAYIPISNITPFDNIKYLEDKNWRGSMVEDYGIVQGNIYSEFDFGGDVFADTIGWPVAGVLGDVTTTGASDPYTHAIAIKNNSNGQTTSYTITDYDAVNARQFAGVQFHEVDFKFTADGLLTYAAKGTGFQSAVSATITTATGAAGTVTYTAANNFYVGQVVSITGNSLSGLNLTSQTIVTASATQFTVTNAVTGTGTGGTATVVTPTTSYTTVPPQAVWTGVSKIAGTTVAIIEDGNCNITRPVTPIFTVDGNQAPYQLFQGPVAVTGSLTLVLEDDTQLLNYLNNSQPSLQINFTTGTAATAGYRQIQLNMTKCAFTVAKVDRGSDYVQLKVDYKAVANTTDVGSTGGYSPIKVTLQNALPASTYI